MAPLPSTRINELHVSDQYVNEKEQSLLVWLNNEMEGDQPILANSCVICSLTRETRQDKTALPLPKRKQQTVVEKMFPIA